MHAFSAPPSNTILLEPSPSDSEMELHAYSKYMIEARGKVTVGRFKSNC